MDSKDRKTRSAILLPVAINWFYFQPYLDSWMTSDWSLFMLWSRSAQSTAGLLELTLRTREETFPHGDIFQWKFILGNIIQKHEQDSKCCGAFQRGEGGGQWCFCWGLASRGISRSFSLVLRIWCYEIESFASGHCWIWSFISWLIQKNMLKNRESLFWGWCGLLQTKTLWKMKMSCSSSYFTTDYKHVQMLHRLQITKWIHKEKYIRTRLQRFILDGFKGKITIFSAIRTNIYIYTYIFFFYWVSFQGASCDGGSAAVTPLVKNDPPPYYSLERMWLWTVAANWTIHQTTFNVQPQKGIQGENGLSVSPDKIQNKRYTFKSLRLWWIGK